MSFSKRNGRNAKGPYRNTDTKLFDTAFSDFHIASVGNVAKVQPARKRLRGNYYGDHPSAPGVVSSRQLEHIRTFLEHPKQSDTVSADVISGEANNTTALLETVVPQRHNLSQEDERMISAVMMKVAELNVNKLPDSSLVKLLTSVYLDAKSKLEDKKISVPTESSEQCLSDSNTQNTLREQRQSGYAAVEHQGTPTPLSVVERKRIQWETEKAELARLSSYHPWGESTPSTVTENINGRIINTSVNRATPILIDSTGSSHTTMSSSSPSTVFANSRASSFIPVALAANEDAEILRREMQRRRWKAELDEQVREQRLLREKRLMEVTKSDAVQTTIQPSQLVAEHGCLDYAVSDSLKTLPQHPANPHPSDSHFCSSTLVPDSMYPMPAPVMKPQFSPLRLDSQSSTALHYNRTRGFTQELYSSPPDEAARIRRAQEISRINLEQIEEKRRLKEEEKARRLLEDRLEEARLERERARLAAITEAELRERQIRETEEDERNRSLIDALQRAREEAAFKKKQMMFDRLHPNEPEVYGQMNRSSSKWDEWCAPQSYSSSSPMEKQRSIQPNAWSATNSIASPGVRSTVPDVVPSVVTSEDAACQTAPTAPEAAHNNNTKNVSKRHACKVVERARACQTSVNKQSPASHGKSHLSHVTGAKNANSHATTPSATKTIKPHISSATGGSFGHYGSTSSSDRDKTSHCVRGMDNGRSAVGQSSVPFVGQGSTQDSAHLRSTPSSAKPRSRIPVPVTSRSSSLSRSRPNMSNLVPSNSPLFGRHSVCHQPTYTNISLLRTDDVLLPTRDIGSDGCFVYDKVHLECAVQPSKLSAKPDEPATSYASHGPRPPVSGDRPNMQTAPSSYIDPLTHIDSNHDQQLERQNTILRHLSEIRKGLKIRQMLCESITLDNDDDSS